MTLTDRRAQQILRPYGDWQVADIVIDPESAISDAKSRMSGTNAYVVDGQRWDMRTTSKGIELGDSDPREVLGWVQVKRIARAAPEHLRVALVDNRSRYNLHARDYPRFTVTAEAAGCGPMNYIGPLTPSQALYVEQYEAFIASGVQSRWEATQAALVDERSRLIDEALPLAAATPEPVDLLELLALVGAR